MLTINLDNMCECVLLFLIHYIPQDLYNTKSLKCDIKQQSLCLYINYTSLMKTSSIIKLRIKFHQILRMYPLPVYCYLLLLF